MTSLFYSNLSKDLSLILNNADDYNVIIHVGENDNKKEFYTHSVILRARSSYFKSALSTNWITKKNNMIIFNKPNITPTIFDIIIKYIYTGELDLTKQPGENILGLLIASDELLLEELFEYVQNYLIEKRTSWIYQNFVLVLNDVFRLDSCKKLQNYCLESICKDPLPFITSKSCLLLDDNVVFSLLKRDDLQVREIIIWNFLIEWGIEQTPDLRSDRNNWNNENYETLEKTLNQFIPLIRFVGISHEELIDKVQPYKAIIPNNLLKEIEEFCYNNILPTLPLRTRKIESNIIKSELINLIIVNWIDKKDIMITRTGNDPLYKFNLIYRGSRDGINNKSFKNKCNGRVASLVLIKVSGSNRIFGGYSSIGFSALGNNLWNKYDGIFYDSSDNFIFSFENSEDIHNIKIGRIINKDKAIQDIETCGFNFGWSSLSMINTNLNIVNHGIYERILPTEEIFYITELETFTSNNHTFRASKDEQYYDVADSLADLKVSNGENKDVSTGKVSKEKENVGIINVNRKCAAETQASRGYNDINSKSSDSDGHTLD
ncbi:BTB-domain-containing protein [Rhizophagus irregularis]|uniref:BTB-domain-containing protein n=1 Tax=Rhizophagus irregularis TaxID=588596 RepID=A0A2I1H546_9GLOM|nr:BTB-domain-containing protein [Rhizophagus irregularis]